MGVLITICQSREPSGLMASTVLGLALVATATECPDDDPFGTSSGAPLARTPAVALSLCFQRASESFSAPLPLGEADWPSRSLPALALGPWTRLTARPGAASANN